MKIVAVQISSVVKIGNFILDMKPTIQSKGNRILLSLGQILMQTILAAIFCEFFFADFFLFDAN